MATLNLAINAAGAQAGAVNFKNATISIEGSAKSAAAAVSSVDKSVAAMGSTLSHVFAAAGIAIGIKSIVDTFIAFDTGIVRVGKSSGISGDQLKYLGDQFIALSTRVPLSTEKLLEIGYAAGQLGVHGSENILKFTETIAKLSTTGNLSGEAAAKSLARILNVTKEGMSSVDKLASTIVQVAHGGNGVRGSAATESEIAFTTTKVAQAGAPFGMKSADAVALAAAYASIGVPAQIAATSTAKAMQTFSDAARAGDTLHGKLGEIAEVAGMTAKEFQDLQKKDPTQAFTKFIEGLGHIGAEGGNTKKILDQLGLSDERLRRAILPLAGSAEDLTAKLKLAREEFANPQRLAAEAEKQFNTFGAQLTILGNSFKAFFLLQREGASPLLTFLKNLNEALQIMLGLKAATDQTTPAVKNLVSAIEIFVTLLEVWAALKMAQLIRDMWVNVLGLGEGIAKATILSNPLLTAVLAIGVALASWAIGKTLFDQFEEVRQFGISIITLLAKADSFFKGSKVNDAWKGYYDKRIAAGDSPDVANMDTAIQQLASRGMLSNLTTAPQQYLGRLRIGGQLVTKPMNAQDQAMFDARVAANAAGNFDPSNQFLDMLKGTTIKNANNEAPGTDFGTTFKNNVFGSMSDIKKQFGEFFGVKDLSAATKNLHKDMENASGTQPQGDFTEEDFAMKHNSLQKMLDDLKLEGTYLKQNNLEQKISETLAKATEKSADEDIANRQDLLDLIAKQIRLNAQEKATRDIGKELDKQSQMVELLKKTDDEREVETQYMQLVNKYQEEGITFADTYLAGLKAQLKVLQQHKQEYETVQNIAHGIGDAFGNAFENAILHAKSFADVMKSLIQDISQTIVHELVTKQLVKGITGFISSALSGGGRKPVEMGNTDQMTLTTHALGDVVSSPTFFNYNGGQHVMGEAGPEGIMPLARDSSGRLGVRGGGGNITINVNTPDADSFRKSMPQLARAARRAMGG